jgi:hypothetical protein
MSARELILLSPYRVPAQNSLSLSDEDTAAFLNGYLALWHPAVVAGAANPPKIAPSYDYEQPSAGHIYAVPETPPLMLPDDWDQRVTAAGAIAFRATPDRLATLENLTKALLANPVKTNALLVTNYGQVQSFYAIGLGFVMVNALFEAMEHENLLAATDLWQDMQQAAEKLRLGNSEECNQHLQTAAGRLQSGREILYPSPAYVLDLYLLDEGRLSEPLPAAFARDMAINVIGSVELLEKLGRAHPEQLDAFRERFQNDKLEICSGPYVEREDALLPVEAQLWNLLNGARAFQELLGSEARVYGRKRFAAHPQLPMFLSNAGIGKALLLAFDNGVLPNFRSAVVHWPSPDGKQVETFVRAPHAADSPQTFFHLAHHFRQSLRQDQAATLALLHKDKPAAPWYEDWLELTRFAPVFGQWFPLSKYFSEAMAGEYVSASPADDFHSDYLEERTTAKSKEPVGWFAQQARQRRRIETAWTLASIYRGLAGKSDTSRFDERLTQLEDKLEAAQTFDVFKTSEASLAETQEQIMQALAGRLLSRAKEERPGYLLLNPCSFIRRVGLELDDIKTPLPIDGPVKACQIDGGKAKLVVEVPPLGFAWFPKAGPPGTPPMKEKLKLADEKAVRNEFFEAEVDPLTGGLRALRDHRLRINRLGQQLLFNPGSKMRATEVKVTSTGPALGEVITSGTIRGEQDQVLAHFRQRFRAWLGRPVLELRIELKPDQPPAGYPWHAYFGARFAWGDERVQLLRGVNGMGYISSHTRPETPDFLELRLGQHKTALFLGGLPFHQRQGPRMLDVILVPEGETTQAFELALGVEREHLMHTAQGMVTPVPLLATAKGPPHVGAAGWLFHLDAPNLVLTSMRPLPDGADGVTCRFLEVNNHSGPAELRCVRDPKHATVVNAKGEMQFDATLNGDAVSFESTACDLVQLKVSFSD